jgi:prepilin-type processing-associated H-X9-DG protein
MNDKPRPDGAVTHYPVTYAANMGTWFVYDPNSGVGSGEAAFPVNQGIRMTHIYDGTSNTVGFAEVKAFTPYLRDSGNPNGLNVPPPTPTQIPGFGGNFRSDSGHTEWVDARVHQTGYTHTFTPNTKVLHSVGGVTYDIDFTSSREGSTTNRITYAAVTSRSYHTGGLVNVLMMDGSVRSVSQNIQPQIWWALGTRNGGELVSDF